MNNSVRIHNKKTIKDRIISIFLILTFVFTLLPLGSIRTNAASNNRISVLSYRFNEASKKYELTVTWVGNKSTDHADLKYHKENTTTIISKDKIFVTELESINNFTSRFAATIDVSALQQNYIYDLYFQMFDNTDGQLGDGTLFFMTGSTFTSERVEQSLAAPGKFESGVYPELKLDWTMPKTWDGTDWVFANAPSAKAFYKSKLNLDKNIDTMNFRINISKSAQNLDSGPDVSPILIDETLTGYNAYVFKDINTKSVTPKSDGKMTVNVVGRKDEQTTPSYATSTTDTRLYHPQFLPGTVYFMNIKPQFMVGGMPYDAITVGDPKNFNGSLVTDAASNLSYTYTPVRFEITRDASDNVYVTAYRINKDDGSLDMPNLYYSIQAIDLPSDQYGTNWPEKARMTDQFFPKGSQYAVTVLSGIDTNTALYYRVVVKTDSKQDRLESLKMKYQMSLDSSKPPIPINVKVDREKSVMVTGPEIDPATGTTMKDKANNDAIVRSTDIVISWDKPTNWDTMDPSVKNDLVYHVIINTNVEDLNIKYPLEYYTDKEKEYYIKYRWVKAINASKLEVNGKRLEYTIKGFNIFENVDGYSGTSSLKNPDNYPTWLVENTIYYAKVFTTKKYTPAQFETMNDNTADGVINRDDFIKDAGASADTQVSQTSVPCSFTTLPGVDKQVPVPTGFSVTGEDIEGQPAKNYITLQFDRINIDWSAFTNTTNNKEVYELFMASGSGANSDYIQIGASDNNFVQTESGMPTAQMSLVQGVWTAKVPNLKPNTIYKFKLRLRLDFSDASMTDVVSEYTAVVSVTTRKIEIVGPDDTLRNPKAPTDFNIAKLSDGTLNLSSKGVGLSWTNLEDDVTYRLIVTPKKISQYDPEDRYKEEPIYKDFRDLFASDSNKSDYVDSLDPKYPGGNFSYTQNIKNCKYTINGFMSPNTLYYYSLRAERKVTKIGADGKPKDELLVSTWVTIPVTTSLIEQPLDLETVVDYQLAVNWQDSDTKAESKDFKIYIRETGKPSYVALDITKATITKDNTQYYGRIVGLKPNTSYDIEVYKLSNASKPEKVTLNSNQSTQKTRDEFHNVEVKWKGVEGVNYELAIRIENTGEYVTLRTPADLQNKQMDVELYTEKTQSQIDTEYCTYYAKIKTMPYKLSDGNIVYVPLKSNTKYYIKARAITKDSESAYTGPVVARTSFNQDDYDNGEDLEETLSKLVDRVEELEKKPYYSLSFAFQGASELLLKADRIGEEVRASSNKKVDLNLEEESLRTRKDVILIPEELTYALKQTGTSLNLKLNGYEYTLLPETLDSTLMKEAEELKKASGVKEVWFKLTVARPDGGTEGMSITITPVTNVNICYFDVNGSNTKYMDVKKDFVDVVYNAETGLIKKKKDKLAELFNMNPAAVMLQDKVLVDMLYSEIERELTDYASATIKGGKGKQGVIVAQKAVKELVKPLLAKANVNTTTDYYEPYALFIDTNNWTNIFGKNIDRAVSYEIYRSGKYVIATKKASNKDWLPKDHWSYNSFAEFNKKYNLSDVFNTNGILQVDMPLSVKEAVLLYEKCFAGNEISPSNIAQKCVKLGISKYISGAATVKNVSREEAASLLIMAYSRINNLDVEGLQPEQMVLISDGNNISQKHSNNVDLAISMDILSLNEKGEFSPNNFITRAEFVDALYKVVSGN